MTSFSLADEVDSIDFIRYFHDLETEGDLYVSWAGGAVIELKGEGFHDTPVANSVYFRTTGLGGDVTVPGTAMTGKSASYAGAVLFSLTNFLRGKSYFKFHFRY